MTLLNIATALAALFFWGAALWMFSKLWDESK